MKIKRRSTAALALSVVLMLLCAGCGSDVSEVSCPDSGSGSLSEFSAELSEEQIPEPAEEIQSGEAEPETVSEEEKQSTESQQETAPAGSSEKPAASAADPAEKAAAEAVKKKIETSPGPSEKDEPVPVSAGKVEVPASDDMSLSLEIPNGDVLSGGQHFTASLVVNGTPGSEMPREVQFIFTCTGAAVMNAHALTADGVVFTDEESGECCYQSTGGRGNLDNRGQAVLARFDFTAESSPVIRVTECICR